MRTDNFNQQQSPEWLVHRVICGENGTLIHDLCLGNLTAWAF